MMLLGKQLSFGFNRRADGKGVIGLADGLRSASGLCSCAGASVCRARPMAKVRSNKPTSCVVKALVEATPISGPARVSKGQIQIHVPMSWCRRTNGQTGQVGVVFTVT